MKTRQDGGESLSRIAIHLDAQVIRSMVATLASTTSASVMHSLDEGALGRPAGDLQIHVARGQQRAEHVPVHRIPVHEQAAVLHDLASDDRRCPAKIHQAAAPSVADLDGDGNLEIVLLSFDHGVDVYTVPGSGSKCLPWPTAPGNLLRNGQGPATIR